MKYLFFCVLMLLGRLSAIVIEAPNLEIVEKKLADVESGALVVFDVDHTFIIPKDQVLGPSGESFMRGYMKEKGLDAKRIEHLTSIVMQQSQCKLVENKVLSLLEMLKQKQVKVIALTAMKAGPLGIIPSLMEWRVKQLSSVGIHLGDAFPQFDGLALRQFHGVGLCPFYKKGILAAGWYPKGMVLYAFLNRIRFQPTEVIFVDDRYDFITSVEQEMEKRKIPHISFHYKAVRNQKHPFDKDLARFQLDHLLKYDEWLSDAEARKRLSAAPITKHPPLG